MGLLDFVNKMLKQTKDKFRVEAAFCLRNVLSCELEEIHIHFCENRNLLKTLY